MTESSIAMGLVACQVCVARGHEGRWSRPSCLGPTRAGVGGPGMMSSVLLKPDAGVAAKARRVGTSKGRGAMVGTRRPLRAGDALALWPMLVLGEDMGQKAQMARRRAI